MTLLPPDPEQEREKPEDAASGGAAPDGTDADTVVTGLRTQYGTGIIGVPGSGIRLSWTIRSADPDARQTAYRVQARSVSRTDGPGEWVEVAAETSDVQHARVPDIEPGGERELRVGIATPSGWSAWSDVLRVEAALDPARMGAAVIGIPSETGGPSPVLRREFRLDAAPVRARLTVGSLGLSDVRVNGRAASDEHLSPGWTSYQRRTVTATLDVTELLSAGDNAIAIALGDGWYRGRMGFAGRTEIYGDRLGALARLDVELATGERVSIVTDGSWRGGFGAVRFSDIYDGAVIDLREAAVGVDLPGFDDAAWAPASVLDADLSLFEPRVAPPVRTIEERAASLSSHAGRTRIDAGQNVSGWVRLTVEGGRGDTVTVRHAEILGPDDGLYTAALRSAKATDVYTLADDRPTVLEPVFTFHGFRYAEVETDARVTDAVVVAISSDLPERSSFRSSHAVLDRFHDNVRWSQRDNFVSVPTDCPQRDERLGWTGDAQAFANTANTLLDSETFWMSWLRDLEIDQDAEGAVASVVPDIIRVEDMLMGGTPTRNMGKAGWADAATIVPLSVYDSYGSTEVLERQLGSMRRWVGYLRNRTGGAVLLPTEDFQYGDWLDPDAPGDRPWAAKTSSDFVTNAFYVHSVRLLARAERVVGDPDAAGPLEELADEVAAATWEAWGEEAARTQTGAALSLEFRIAPEERREAVADWLASDVRRLDGRISTGFLGTPLVLFALSNAGRLDEAYRMLLCREAPSWLYQVDRGATTVWERWDAIREDGSIHDGAMDTSEGDSMLSFNHYAYGAMVDWVYRTVAGLSPAEPGYRRTRVAPRPAVGLESARATIDTRYGALGIDWAIERGVLRARVEVPFGVTAVLDLPVTDASAVTVGDADGRPCAETPAVLSHGVHTIEVTAPAVADPHREENAR